MNGTITELAEAPVPGPIPRWEIPGWRERFGVVAGLTGRGGPEHGPAGFDLGLWGPSPAAAVMANWQAFFQEMPGFTTAGLSRQVHGTRLLGHSEPSAGWHLSSGYDAHIAWEPGTVVLVTVADCIPVYLLDPDRQVSALIHAGWRGVAGGILKEVVDLFHTDREPGEVNLVMHCGIGISGSCYEVGDDVAIACGKVRSESGRQQLDLREVLALQGETLGVREITVSPHCTATRADAFFSHRRSEGRDGRQVAFLGRPGADPSDRVL